jgi:hypothetical protein
VSYISYGNQLLGRLPGAIASALNQAADAARTQLVRDVEADMKFSERFVGARIKTRLATTSNQVATVVANTKSIPAMALGATVTPQGGVVTSRRRYPKAFIARMPSGHTGVFQRRAKPASRSASGSSPLCGASP